MCKSIPIYIYIIIKYVRFSSSTTFLDRFTLPPNHIILQTATYRFMCFLFFGRTNLFRIPGPFYHGEDQAQYHCDLPNLRTSRTMTPPKPSTIQRTAAYALPSDLPRAEGRRSRQGMNGPSTFGRRRGRDDDTQHLRPATCGRSANPLLVHGAERRSGLSWHGVCAMRSTSP
jgi:hypothetical protein